MKYTILNLREALLNSDFKSYILDAIDRFRVEKDVDVENFLKSRAINHSDILLSTTYLYLVIDQKRLDILGYFTIVNNKGFNIKQVSTEYKTIIQIDGDENNNQSAILIAQIGRNSKYHSTDINMDHFISDIFSIVKSVVNSVGGRFIILDCKDVLIEKYKSFNFELIKKSTQTNNRLNTMMFFAKNL